MADKTPLLFLVIIALLFGQSLQDVNNNKIDLEPLQDLASQITQSKNIDKIGGMLSKLIEKQGGKNIADMLVGLSNNDNSDATAQILKGLGSIIQEKLADAKPDNQRGETSDKADSGFNVDPALIGNLISMMGSGKDEKESSGEPSFDPSIIANIASMFAPKKEKESSGFDPALIANMISMFVPKSENSKQQASGFDLSIITNLISMFASNSESSKQRSNSGFDILSIVQTVTNMMSQEGSENVMSYFPTILNTLNSFVGPEAEEREEGHSDHSWMMPPLLEKLHVLLDHFIHSPFGQNMLEQIGAEKYVKIFADERTGNFSYNKFVELLENHSFRKHWLSMVTKKVTDVVSYFADPYTQRKFVQTTQFFINNFLKQRGVPKAALFDPVRPTETLSALVNHFSKQFLGQKVDAKKYIGPAVKYVQDLLELAKAKGIVGREIDSEKLTNKLTDTINLDIIEPVVRVNRAFRFASKVPKCDKYVICLVNQELPQDDPSLPGLKKGLSKTASIIASWFLSSRTGTSFWSLYGVIMEDDNCQVRYLDECHDFHLEEIKVTTEYVHNEL